MPNLAEIWQADRVLEDYVIGDCLEPDHGFSHSERAFAATRDGVPAVIKWIEPPWPIVPAAKAAFADLIDEVKTISSPHVIPVIDRGVNVDGKPYYVMEWSAGEPLLARIRRGETHDAATTAGILHDLWRALAAAGNLRVDVHPRHVMLTDTGARLWNVGIAGWQRDAYKLVEATWTRAGVIIWHGNLTPDEARGAPWTAANTGAQIALLAFNLLTGRWYWDADNKRESSLDLLMEAMSPTLVAASLRARRALPRGFDPWFARCLTGGFCDPQDAIAEFPT